MVNQIANKYTKNFYSSFKSYAGDVKQVTSKIAKDVKEIKFQVKNKKNGKLEQQVGKEGYIVNTLRN